MVIIETRLDKFLWRLNEVITWFAQSKFMNYKYFIIIFSLVLFFSSVRSDATTMVAMVQASLP